MTARWVCFVLPLVVACSKPSAPPPEEHRAPPTPSSHKDEPEHAELPSKVRLSETVIREAKIRTAASAREPLAVTLSLPGELAPDPDKSARVASPVAGRLERVDLKEGGSVKKGDILAVVKIPELGRLRAEALAMTAKAAAARANADRLKALQAQRFAADQDVVNAETEAKALEDQARGINEQLTALGGGTGASSLTLRAPVSGIVLTRDAIVGQPITAEQTIASIADLSELWFLGRVFEKDLGRLKAGAPTEVVLNAYPNQTFRGQVEYIGKQIDPGSRTVTARIRLSNRDDLLRIGLFGTARVATEEQSAPVLVVPTDAVTQIADKPAVFVRQPDGDFEVHMLTLGRPGPGKVEVLAGLREGEQVVVDGVFTVKSAILKSTFAEEEE
ncbi:MAG TPA: efflux RND transporter periplasmic adaptor subunit [Polyangiaceae bacterium]|nr:efflux RND transporter periplasmic adaptor subunit [Polyangiaceae bacterium]